MVSTAEPMFFSGNFHAIGAEIKGKAVDLFEQTFDPSDLDYIDQHKNRVVEGYANTQILDRVDDIVDPKAFQESLERYLTNPILRYNHETGQVVGKITEAFFDDKGLFIRARIARKTKKGDETWILILQGMLRAFSIYGVPLEQEKKRLDDGRVVNYITKFDLHEIAIVDIPANHESLLRIVSKGVNNKTIIPKDTMPMTRKRRKNMSIVETKTQPVESKTVTEKVKEKPAEKEKVISGKAALAESSRAPTEGSSFVLGENEERERGNENISPGFSEKKLDQLLAVNQKSLELMINIAQQSQILIEQNTAMAQKMASLAELAIKGSMNNKPGKEEDEEEDEEDEEKAFGEEEEEEVEEEGMAGKTYPSGVVEHTVGSAQPVNLNSQVQDQGVQNQGTEGYGGATPGTADAGVTYQGFGNEFVCPSCGAAVQPVRLNSQVQDEGVGRQGTEGYGSGETPGTMAPYKSLERLLEKADDLQIQLTEKKNNALVSRLDEKIKGLEAQITNQSIDELKNAKHTDAIRKAARHDISTETIPDENDEKFDISTMKPGIGLKNYLSEKVLKTAEGGESI